MVEFAFVVVLLIALLYGIISYGLILSAQSTVTQAAADGARAGIVATSSAVAAAEGQAANDLNWMDKGQCYERDVPSGQANAAISCTATTGELPVECQQSVHQGHRFIQLRIGSALPDTPWPQHHHSLHYFVN